ncbi:MAG: zinc ABC transporter substrate-binding protein [Parachlamydiaceae bacterium]|nr:zinc ABC transporter substrate-binding protein [Parachlamydiaceae bacterium]
MSLHLSRSIFIFLLILSAAFTLPCIAESGKQLPFVLVSVAPDKFFVEKIAGDTATVLLMVPAGASSHSFEPTPKQMMNAAHADLWFQIGEGFEPRASLALKRFQPSLQLIDLRKGLDLIVCNEGEEGYCKCCHGTHDSAIDPHFWLSAREAKKQAVTIANALSLRYPEHQQLYKERLVKFLKELEDLDLEITKILDPWTNRVIMVSHPAYAYFCRDYNIKQLSIEFEGKDPTPSQLTKILKQAKEYKIATIFIQMQYNNKGARLIAKEIGANVVTLDPYAEDFFASMREIAKKFADQQKTPSR